MRGYLWVLACLGVVMVSSDDWDVVGGGAIAPLGAIGGDAPVGGVHVRPGAMSPSGRHRPGGWLEGEIVPRRGT